MASTPEKVCEVFEPRKSARFSYSLFSIENVENSANCNPTVTTRQSVKLWLGSEKTDSTYEEDKADLSEETGLLTAAETALFTAVEKAYPVYRAKAEA